MSNNYDVIIVGAGAGGMFVSYELAKLGSGKNVLLLEKGRGLQDRHCPMSGGKSGNCAHCDPCSIMNGFGGAGTLSDGKYNITTEFGGELHLFIGREEALALMEYVDEALVSMGGQDAKLYSTANSELKRIALQNNLTCLTLKYGISAQTGI